MIYDNIKNFTLYEYINPNIFKALIALKDMYLTEINSKRVEIDADKCYINVAEFETSNVSSDFEGHKKYVDIHFVLHGEERINLTAPAVAEVTEPYDEEKDAVFYQGEVLSSVILKDGMFCICFPDDLHIPGLIGNVQCKVEKAVAKVKI